MTRRSWLAVVLLVSACSRDRLIIPAVPGQEDFPTEVLVVGPVGSGNYVAAYFYDLREPADVARFEFDLPLRFEAFLLDQTIDELGVPAGLHGINSGRPIPVQKSYSAVAEEGAPDVTWRIDSLPKWSRAVLVPDVDHLRCGKAGGCVVDTECSIPCPSRLPITPAEPAGSPSWSCRAGWGTQAIALSGAEPIIVCETAALAADSCMGGMTIFPGETECTDVGAPCPASGFGAEGSGPTFYVSAQGTVGAQGTREDPFSSVADAVAGASEGATILIGSGRFSVGDLTLTSRVTLRGGCPGLSEIVGTIGADTDASISDITITGSVVSHTSGKLSLRRVVLHGPSENAILADGGDIDLQRVLVRGDVERGIRAQSLGTVQGVDVAIISPSTGGVLAQDGALVDLTNIVVTQAGIERAIAATMSATVSANGLVVVGGHGLRSTEGTVTISNAIFRNVDDAVVVSDTADVTMNAVWIDVASDGVWNSSAGTITVQDLVVTDAALVKDTTATAVFNGGVVFLDHVAMIDTTGGVFLFNGASATLFDLIVDGTIAMGARPHAVFANEARGVHGERLRFRRLEGAAFVTLKTRKATLMDVSIADCLPGACLVCGGVCPEDGSVLEMHQIDVNGIYGTAVRGEESTVTITNASIANVMKDDSCGMLELENLRTFDGIASDSASMDVSQFVIEKTANASIRLSGSHGTADGPITFRDGTIDSFVFDLAEELPNVFSGVEIKDASEQ